MTMPKETAKIKFDMTETEIRFIEFCRRQQFFEGRIIVMDGQPKRLFAPIKSIRFDVPGELSTDDGLDNNNEVNLKLI